MLLKLCNFELDELHPNEMLIEDVYMKEFLRHKNFDMRSDQEWLDYRVFLNKRTEAIIRQESEEAISFISNSCLSQHAGRIGIRPAVFWCESISELEMAMSWSIALR